MSRFEVIRGVEGYCLALDDKRIAGPKPWGGGDVIHAWETDKVYTQERTCEYIGDEISGGCSVCRGWLDPDCAYCPSCGAKVVE